MQEPSPWAPAGNFTLCMVGAETGIPELESRSFYIPMSHMQPLGLPVSLSRDLMSSGSPGLILGSRRKKGSPSKAVHDEDKQAAASPRGLDLGFNGIEARDTLFLPEPDLVRVGQWQMSHCPAAEGQAKLLSSFICQMGTNTWFCVPHWMEVSGGRMASQGGVWG